MSKTALALADSGESSELILVVILVAVCVVLGIIWSVLAWLIKERIRLIDETQRKESVPVAAENSLSKITPSLDSPLIVTPLYNSTGLKR